MDGSTSVSASEFNTMSELVATMVEFFNSSSTLVGVMEYSESANVWIR